MPGQVNSYNYGNGTQTVIVSQAVNSNAKPEVLASLLATWERIKILTQEL